MNVATIDHVNIRIPDDGVEAALEFYRDVLGFEPENLDAFRSGDRTIFSFRLASESVIHIRPKDSFRPPDRKNYDHFALVIDEPIDDIRSRLEGGDVEIEREGNPLGATGRAPAVYVRDPFGYLIELKTTVD